MSLHGCTIKRSHLPNWARDLGIKDFRTCKGKPVDYPAEVRRPKTRGDCQGHEGSCPFVTCRYHLAVDVTAGGSLRLRDQSMDVREPSCALDMADEGPHTLEEVGQAMGLHREMIRLIEEQALAKMRRAFTGEDTPTRTRVRERTP